MYKVMIVDDQKSALDQMKYAILQSHGKYVLQKTLTEADGALGALEEAPVDLILMDIYTNGRECGIKVAKEIKEKYPNIKIIILTFVLQKRHIEEAHAAGCEGFWYKDHTDIDLLHVMDHVMEGATYFPESQPTVMIGMAKASDFTEKELAVLQAKVNGHTNEKLCELLHIKQRTLDTHISRIKSKTGYNNLLRLVADITAKKFLMISDDGETE